MVVFFVCGVSSAAVRYIEGSIIALLFIVPKRPIEAFLHGGYDSILQAHREGFVVELRQSLYFPMFIDGFTSPYNMVAFGDYLSTVLTLAIPPFDLVELLLVPICSCGNIGIHFTFLRS